MALPTLEQRYMKELLSTCDCDSACSKCLKHYRNQYVHGILDRFAALQLLRWGVEGIKATPIESEAQGKMIRPIISILKQSGCDITLNGEITVSGARSRRMKLVIYPAMWVEPQSPNTIYVSDAVQAVGHISVDVKELGVDMLSASAHKFGGPRGVGFLYVRENVTLPPFMDGGSQEAGMRAGTENVAAVVGMAAALKTSCREMHETAQRLYECEKILVSSLAHSRINFIRNGAEHHVPGNVSLSFRDVVGEMLLHRLDLMGICISTGSACNSINTQRSHVIESIGVPRKYADGTIRISFGRDSSLKDAEMISSAIIKVLAR